METKPDESNLDEAEPEQAVRYQDKGTQGKDAVVAASDHHEAGREEPQFQSQTMNVRHGEDPPTRSGKKMLANPNLRRRSSYERTAAAALALAMDWQSTHNISSSEFLEDFESKQEESSCSNQSEEGNLQEDIEAGRRASLPQGETRAAENPTLSHGKEPPTASVGKAQARASMREDDLGVGAHSIPGGQTNLTNTKYDRSTARSDLEAEDPHRLRALKIFADEEGIASGPGAFAVHGTEDSRDRETQPEDVMGLLSGDNLVVAELANDSQTEELLREVEQENEALREELQRITSNAVAAERVQAVDISMEMMEASGGSSQQSRDGEAKMDRRILQKNIGILVLISILVIAVAVAVPTAILIDTDVVVELVTAPPSATNSSSNFSTMPVLEAIHKNGEIRCYAELFEVARGYGFSIDLCRALAAAVLGNASKVAFVEISFGEQFRAITRGEVDISTALNTINMERDVFHRESGYGYTFSDPYYFSGTTFAGVSDFVSCIDEGESFAGICRQLVVCVIENTVTMDIVKQNVPGSSTRPVKNDKELIQEFAKGTCNVIAGDYLETYELRVRLENYTGEYIFSSKSPWSFEPLAMITRQSDPHWSDFSNWVLRSLFAAEYLNITQENAYDFPQTRLFGEEYMDMFRRSIAAVGNYGQMYERHFQERIPRQGMNQLNRGSPTGLLVADPLLLAGDPLGNIQILKSLEQSDVPHPVANGTLETVRRRGYLRCGLSVDLPGFAHFDTSSGAWVGLDVEYCKAVSAALFAGQVDSIEYVNFIGVWSKQFSSLADGSVDILAGGNVLMRSDVKEPMTGKGFSFSPPYFFEERGSRRALVTREDDPQWSDLVRWVCHATIFAESQGITKQNASVMPVVELFGTDYRQLFRDTIWAVGSYKEIYNRTLADLVPRQGWNELNSGNHPQHFPYSFGE